MNKILITGINGMDGSTLADKYLEKGEYQVIGIDRWNPTGPSPNLKEALKNKNFKLITGDINEYIFIEGLIKKYQPAIMYNMAAISMVSESFKLPLTVMKTNTLAVINMLECIKHYSPKTRYYQASSSEQIWKNTSENQNTESRMIPNSPYGISKLASYHFVRFYRETYGLFAVNGMLFNHEGPRRGPDFVTRKITIAVARIEMNQQEDIELGNINTFRDWGNSSDYCDAMILMMHTDKPDDYTVATGETHSIREFVRRAFEVVDILITWEGEGLNEVGKDQEGIIRVKINKEFYRPAEVERLHGDPSKIKKILGWEPKTKFHELVRLMVENDFKEAQNGNL